MIRRDTLNIDYDFSCVPMALRAFRRVLEGEISRYVRRGSEEVDISNIFKDPQFPVSGFRPGILPAHVADIRTNTVGRLMKGIDTMASVLPLVNELHVSYKEELGQVRAAEFWQAAGYNVETRKQTLHVDP